MADGNPQKLFRAQVAAPQAGDEAGWYPDPSERPGDGRWERYWNGESWGGSYRRRRATNRRDDAPRETSHSVAIAALVLSVCSVAIPVVTWAGLPERTTTDTAGGLLLLSLLSCVLALTGLICGVISRRWGVGVVAIVVGVIGGLVSFASFALFGLAIGLGGVSSGL